MVALKAALILLVFVVATDASCTDGRCDDASNMLQVHVSQDEDLPPKAAAKAKAAAKVPTAPVAQAFASQLAPQTVFSITEGKLGTAEYRIRYKDDSGKSISPWHDIPLSPDSSISGTSFLQHSGIFNAVFEMPKNTNAIMEVLTQEPMNPIAQAYEIADDTPALLATVEETLAALEKKKKQQQHVDQKDVKNKKAKLGFYHGPIFWNYGMFPQTWEDPNEKHATGRVNGKNCSGDNNPVDVVEIGSDAVAQGAVEPVKVLGMLALIDEEQLDWKAIAIRMNDKMAKEVNDIADVETKMPGVVSGIREWFRWYKTPAGKPLNQYGFNEKPLGREKALEVLAQTHEAWKKLHSGTYETQRLWLQ